MKPNDHKCIIEDPYYDSISCPEVFGKLLTSNLAENLTTISEFLAGKWVRNFAILLLCPFFRLNEKNMYLQNWWATRNCKTCSTWFWWLATSSIRWAKDLEMIYVRAETNLNIVCCREVMLAMLPEWRSPLSTSSLTLDPTSLAVEVSISFTMLPNKRSRPSLSFSLLWMTCQSWRRRASKYFSSPKPKPALLHLS